MILTTLFVMLFLPKQEHPQLFPSADKETDRWGWLFKFSQVFSHTGFVNFKGFSEFSDAEL